MAVTAHEQGHLAESSRTRQEATARRIWLVESDGGPITPAQAEAAAGLPALGDPHPDYPARKCATIDAKPADGDETREGWAVEATYSDRAEATVHPIFLPDKISWSSSEGAEPYFYDESPTPVPAANSAGEPLDPHPERLNISWEATVERAVASYSPSAAAHYAGSVNSDTFTLDGATIAPRQALLAAIDCGPYVSDDSGVYRTLRFRIRLAPQTWDQRYADRGFKQLASSGGLEDIPEAEDGPKVESSWPLDGQGRALPSPTDEPATLTLLPYRQLPFNAFNFG